MNEPQERISAHRAIGQACCMDEIIFGRKLRNLLLGLLGADAAGTPRIESSEKRGAASRFRPGAELKRSPSVERFTLPEAGTDVVDITIEETYSVDGVGQDTVLLRGTLEAERATPLVGSGEKAARWDSALVVARFTALHLRGQSDVFGPIEVELDDSTPAFGAVQSGKCRAAIPISVRMEKHGITLRTEAPMQLQSDVSTVPPIGDEKTQSIAPVRLIDTATGRTRGELQSARVAWRTLELQSQDAIVDRFAKA